MERKRIEKLVALLLVGILIPVSLFPFRINADTISSSNIHLNTSLISVNYDRTPYFYNYEYEFVFDKEYVGWVSVNVVSTYYSDNNFTQTQSTFQKAIYVNGGKASITNGFFSSGNYASGCLVSASFSVVNSNVIEYSVINSLDQITDILTDVSNYVSIDVLSELQNIVYNTSLASGYLETITKMRQWNFPIESFSAISNNIHLDVVGFTEFSYWTYPQFVVSNGQYVFNHVWNNANKDITIVMILKGNNAIDSISRFNNQFSYNSRYTIKEFKFISYTDNLGSLFKIVFSASASGYFELVALSDITYVIPIFYGNNTTNISTDFALNFDLSNQLLDDIHTIANGTNQSSSASGSLDQTTSQFSDDANDLVTIEESFNDSMNQSLQNVNPTFNMGSSFLTSANWVSQQFNRIVNDTPFASLITFGLTLGLGLLIIGKVRK